MSTITDLMGYADYIDIEQRYLSQDLIERKYKRETLK
jgi:hypothetical protein